MIELGTSFKYFTKMSSPNVCLIKEGVIFPVFSDEKSEGHSASVTGQKSHSRCEESDSNALALSLVMSVGCTPDVRGYVVPMFWI